MGERKHNAEGGEKKATQPQREEERQSERQPAKALERLSTNVAQPTDIQTLQRALGNRAVTNLIQRHPKATMAAYNFFGIGRRSRRKTEISEGLPAEDLKEQDERGDRQVKEQDERRERKRRSLYD